MASIAISAGTMRPKAGAQGGGLIGVTESPKARPEVQRASPVAPRVEAVSAAAVGTIPQKQEPSEIQKVVRKMPTLYVITFFGVVVGCAVLIIWNTLQVNRLTGERTKLDDQIVQAEQRLLKARAEEMQLSAPSRVEDLARTKLGMVEATGDDIVILKK
jgi:cell division protein FtsL